MYNESSLYSLSSNCHCRRGWSAHYFILSSNFFQILNCKEKLKKKKKKEYKSVAEQ